MLVFSIRLKNEHDSKKFKPLFDIKTMVMDSGYKTLAIAKILIDDGSKPLMPYVIPKTKEGFSINTNMYMMNIFTAT